MNTLLKLSAGTITTVSMAFLFAGSTFAQSYNQGTATWPYQADAKCYQIFYKENTASSWQHAVHCRDLKNPVWQYTIKYLKPGVSYIYKVREIANIDNGNKYRWITNDMNLPVSAQPQQ